VRVGVLALQGDFSAHRAALSARGVGAVEVRSSGELGGLAGIVFPGGESTTMLHMLRRSSLGEDLARLVAGGLPVLATCAGMILLAREVRGPAQESLGLLDVVVERNAYGRQSESAVVPLVVEETSWVGTEGLEGVFIRAPRVVALGPDVSVLARRGDDPVLVRQNRILAATFHPELSVGSPVVDRFVGMCGGAL
jgi:5'-phosphate synthase pdxT subunit